MPIISDSVAAAKEQKAASAPHGKSMRGRGGHPTRGGSTRGGGRGASHGGDRHAGKGDGSHKTFPPGRGRGTSRGALANGRGGSRGGYNGKRDKDSGGAKPAFLAKAERKGDKFDHAKSLDLPMGGDGKWYEHIPEIDGDVDDKKRKRGKKGGDDQVSAEDLKEQARQRMDHEVWAFDNKGKGALISEPTLQGDRIPGKP